MSNNMTEYFKALTSEPSVRAIAARAELDPSTTDRQLSGRNELKVRTVVDIARAYGLPLGDLFVAVGFITEAEAATLGIEQALEVATEEQLLHEMLRRVADGRASEVLTEPVSDEALANVTELRPNDSGFLDDAIHDEGLDTAAGSDETQADDD